MNGTGTVTVGFTQDSIVRNNERNKNVNRFFVLHIRQNFIARMTAQCLCNIWLQENRTHYKNDYNILKYEKHGYIM